MNPPRTLQAFVVDDEAPARRKIARFLKQDPEIALAGEASNGRNAVRAIRQLRPDLVFLDVQMPGMDGFEVVRALEAGPVPRIVFVTAHDEYALQALEIHAFGYLLKPFDQARFAQVLADAKQHLAQDVAAEVRAQLSGLLAEVARRRRQHARLLIKQRDRAFFLALDTVDWAQSERNYLALHVGRQTYTVRGTLDSLEEKLDPSRFLRLNQSSLVRLDFIRELQAWSHGEYRVVLLSGETLTWTRRYLDRHPELLQRL